jgi:hypothetical protein
LLQGTKSLFKNVPLTDEEREYYRRFKDGIEDDEYKDLSYKEKKIYISIWGALTNEQYENTPNDLINDYITTGVALTDEQFDFIKDKRQLINNYRRVTIDNVIPEYVKGRINFGSRWLVLTDDEAIDLYNKTQVDVSLILQYKPKLFDYFKDKLHELRGYSISRILSRQPQLIEKVEDILYRLNSNNIKDILSKQPQLIGKFEDKLIHLYGADISQILIYQPQLEPYFEKQGLIKESLKYLSLRNILKKQKFENHKRYSI